MPSNANGSAGLAFTPSTPANAVLLTAFILLLISNVALCGRFYQSWGHAIGILCGLLLEVLGYAAKVQLSRNRMNKSAYIMYIIGLTLGPTFLSASLYLCCGRLHKRLFLKPAARLRPRVYTTVFILGDIMCLCFIGVGGSLAAIYHTQPIGVDLMISGLATQILVTTIFCASLAWITCASSRETISKGMWRQFQGKPTQAKGHLADLGNRIRADYFVIRQGASIAAACLLIRSCWRVAELSSGFNGPLTTREGIFIALDSVPMVIMSVILTALHPQLWMNVPQS